MRIRMLKTVTNCNPPTVYQAGRVYDVDPAVASAWGRSGYCIEDRMVDQAPEVKAAVPTVPARSKLDIKRGRK